LVALDPFLIAGDMSQASTEIWQAVAMGEEKSWTAIFEQTFAAPASTVEQRIWREVYGPEFPEGVDSYSYISLTELRRFADEVRTGTDQCLVDIGCGRGGPGHWVAVATGARLIGIDIAESALAHARSRAEQLGLGDRVEYRLGSFEHTGLPDGSAQAVMSVDALLFSPDKAAALAELARIVVPGGRLVLTSWDYHSQPVGRPPQVADHRPLLDEAGFDVLSYEETEAWRERQERTGQALLAAVDELAAESGERPEDVRAEIAEMVATDACIIRRVLIVAQRAPRGGRRWALSTPLTGG
jgi:SAM-dependent methyltransferase